MLQHPYPSLPSSYPAPLDSIYSTAHGDGMEERRQSLLEMKLSSTTAIAELESLKMGASAEELSVIERLLIVERNNVKFSDIALSCYDFCGSALEIAA